jgi:hypothetical protein
MVQSCNEEQGKLIDTIISERLLEIFSNTNKRMLLSVAWLDSVMNKGETTLHTIHTLHTILLVSSANRLESFES